MGIEERLGELGLTLPEAAAPVASYVAALQVGNLLYVSGQIPTDAAGRLMRGTLGRDMAVAEGARAAERCGLLLVAQAKAALGSLDRVAQVVKLNVLVASAPDFTDQPEVANGASDLMEKIFGEKGRHARSSVGVAALPRGVPVEIDAVFAIQ